MMSNKTKINIIIITSLTILGVSTVLFSIRRFRKKRIINSIYNQLNDTTSEEGQQALLEENQQIKASNAFNVNFWKKTSGSPKPNADLLLRPMDARDYAKRLKSKMGLFNDDEAGIVGIIRQLKSKGQVSQVADAYENSICCQYGNLADDIIYALTGITDSPTYIKQLNNYINGLQN